MSQLKNIKNRIKIQKQIYFLSERVRRYSVKYQNTWTIGLHMAYAALGSMWLKNPVKHRQNGNTISIGVIVEGGLGDLIIGLNWLCYLVDIFFKNVSFAFEVGFNNKAMLSCLAPSFVSKCYTKKELLKRSYDVVLSIARVPQVVYADFSRVKKLNPRLLDLLESYISLETKYLPFLELAVYKDSIAHNLPLINPKRWAQPDATGIFNLQEEFILPIKLEDINKVLKKFELQDTPYITVNREVGYDRIMESTKLWPINYYRELVEQLKARYPKYKIVEIGTGKGERLGNTHLNLAGKTSLEEVKVILKNAALHIDSEGGLVHLRHALKGGPSLVFFGPSDPAILGYSENVNLRSLGCSLCCENVNNSWQEGCILQNHVCMKELKVEAVLSALEDRGVLK